MIFCSIEMIKKKLKKNEGINTFTLTAILRQTGVIIATLLDLNIALIS